MKLILPVICSFLLINAGSASGEIPTPHQFGPWSVYCFTGISDAVYDIKTSSLVIPPGAASCTISRDLRVNHARNVGLSLAWRSQGQIELRSYGPSRETCDDVQINEKVTGGANFDRSSADRIFAAFQLHIAMFGACNNMRQLKVPYGPEVLAGSNEDLRRALDFVARRWDDARMETQRQADGAHN